MYHLRYHHFSPIINPNPTPCHSLPYVIKFVVVVCPIPSLKPTLVPSSPTLSNKPAYPTSPASALCYVIVVVIVMAVCPAMQVLNQILDLIQFYM